MKIQVVSDLHLEFGNISITNNDADVLVLSGDICVASGFEEERYSKLFFNFFKECSERFSHVIYICGNHEHYKGDIALTVGILKDKLQEFKNIYILEQEVKVINGVTFIAGTLWTDMNKGDPVTLFHIKSVMNDYKAITDSNEMVSYKFISEGKQHLKQRPSKFTPEKSMELHNKMTQYIKDVVTNIPSDGKVVVVGHHAPCKKSVKPMYEGDVATNGAYSSDLSSIMLDYPQIKLWTHGHTHDSFDYVIGNTRVVCNPRGYYNYMENEHFDPNLIVEV